MYTGFLTEQQISDRLAAKTAYDGLTLAEAHAVAACNPSMWNLRYRQGWWYVETAEDNWTCLSRVTDYLPLH